METPTPVRAKVFIGLVLAAGLPCLLWAGLNWQTDNPLRWFCYLAVTVLVAGLKVTVPGLVGTMSVSFFSTFIGLVELHLSETLALGLGGTIVQTFWNARSRPRPIQLLFNISVVSLAITVAHTTYRVPADWGYTSHVLIRLALVACVYFAANTLPVAAIIALSSGKSVHTLWKETQLWCFPFYVVGACIAGLAARVNPVVGWETTVLAFPVVILIHRFYRLYLQKLELEKKHVTDMAALHLRTIEALALAIDAKDDNTHDHLRRVQVYAIEIAEELGVTGPEMEALRAAVLLHDIGKLAVPEHILCKPGKLTQQEFQKIKIHPLVGAEILERVEFPYPVVPIVRHHHERWDGGGYPDALRGEDIPIGARILSAIDCLDALASERPYRAAMPLDQAMRHVKEESGKAFDPRVVEVLERRYLELEEQSKKLGSSLKKLSKNVVVRHGAQPASGLETSAAEDAQAASSTAQLGNFVASIAAARQEVQGLIEVTQDLGNSLSLNETLSMVAVRLNRLLTYDAIAIYIVRGKQLVPEYVNGEDFRMLSSLRIPLGEGLSGWVAANGKAILNGNPSVEPSYLGEARAFSVLRSALAVPLQDVNGIVGVLTVYRLEKDAFDQDSQRVLAAVSSKLGIAIGNALRFQQAESSATTDGLTGLPNARSLFVHLESELSKAAIRENSVAVLVSDLDGFKAVNDRFGHLEGNRVLQAVAQGFRAVLRDSDYVARMGGDEFVFVLPGVQKQGAERLIPRLQQVARDAGFSVCGEDVLGASIGLAVYPFHGSDAQKLLEEADQRMYAAKANSKHKRGAPAAPVAKDTAPPLLASPAPATSPATNPATNEDQPAPAAAL